MDSNYTENKREGKMSRYSFKEYRLAYVFLFGVIFMLLTFLIIPMCSGIYLSLKGVSPGGRELGFVALRNYFLLASESRFLNNLRLSLLYVGGNVSLSVSFGFLVAHLITTKSKFVNIFRPIFLIPWIIPPVASAILFRTMVDPNFGIITIILRKITGKSYILLSKPQSAMLIVTLHNFWRSFPFAMMFLGAGLTFIPSTLYEAAQIDGAGVRARFRYITLPMVKLHLFIVTLMVTNWTLQDAETVYALTQGGPGYSTEVVAVRLFKESFVYFNLNMGAAIGVILLVVAAIFMFVYSRILKTSGMDSL